MKRSNVATLHFDCGLPPVALTTEAGAIRSDAFLVSGVFVRTVLWLRFVWSAMTGRMGRGVMIYATDDGMKREPRVLLDWETYSRLLMGLREQPLPDLEMCRDDKEGWHG